MRHLSCFLHFSCSHPQQVFRLQRASPPASRAAHRGREYSETTGASRVVVRVAADAMQSRCPGALAARIRFKASPCIIADRREVCTLLVGSLVQRARRRVPYSTSISLVLTIPSCSTMQRVCFQKRQQQREHDIVTLSDVISLAVAVG